VKPAEAAFLDAEKIFLELFAMGVKGLWDVSHRRATRSIGTNPQRDLCQVLQPAAEAVPLTQLSLNAFKENKDGYRALRIGIDAR
jgi:hypothetical protein